MRVTFLAFLLCLVSFPLLADDAYTIETEVIVDELTLGSLTISVYPDTEAKVVVGGQHGQYELLLIATEQENDQVLISTSLTVDGKTVKPSLLVKLGQESSVSIDETTLKILVQRDAAGST